jgi:rhodanese-related sulfurtransferase
MRETCGAVAIAILAAVVSIGCQADTSGLATVTVDELVTLRSGATVTVCDANGASAREKYGVIPGAVLLSSSGDYDVASELPAEKASKVVFYCSSTMCSAAPKAARKAVAAGYADVAVLPVGIKGWVDAGQAVDPAPTG